jgi:hypothetical protein
LTRSSSTTAAARLIITSSTCRKFPQRHYPAIGRQFSELATDAVALCLK